VELKEFVKRASCGVRGTIIKHGLRVREEILHRLSCVQGTRMTRRPHSGYLQDRWFCNGRWKLGRTCGLPEFFFGMDVLEANHYGPESTSLTNHLL
jgi:hypothetical protein